MQIFTAIDIKLMGDMDEKFGQTYYGTVEEQTNPVRFNLKQVVDVAPGRKFVAGEIEHRTSKGSGKPYTQLKKVSLSEPTPVAQTGSEDIHTDMGVPTDSPDAPMGKSLSDEWSKHQIEPPASFDKPTSPPITVPETISETAKSRPDYEVGTNARWAIGMAYRAYQQVMGTPEDGAGDFPFEVIRLHAQELLDMFELLTSKEK